MPAYIGPQQVIIVHSAVPTNVTAASDVTFDDNDGHTLSAYIGGPYQIQIAKKIAVFGGDYAPAPDPEPCPDIPPLPGAFDPPFPPVWPYVPYFSSDTIYGRDTVGVIQTMVRMDTYEMALTATYISNGVALDLTGGALTMTARYEQNSPTAVFQLTTSGGGIVITDATAGEFTVTIPSSATADLPLVRTVLFFDIQYLLGSVRYTVSRGQLIVLPDVTTS